jgi:hypothetical protein
MDRPHIASVKPANAPANLPGPPQGLNGARYRDAAPVKFSHWLCRTPAMLRIRWNIVPIFAPPNKPAQTVAPFMDDTGIEFLNRRIAWLRLKKLANAYKLRIPDTPVLMI